MSAQANSATVAELEQESNGRDVYTLEPICHDYDRVGHTVLAECCVCCTNTGRRLLTRDYDLECDFKIPLGKGDDYYVPTTLWRDCEECGKETTHFVC